MNSFTRVRGCAIRAGSSGAIFDAQLAVQKRRSSLGGRRNPLGFSQPLGKSPQVKQGPERGVARRIPGTTKVKYTNKKGRTFNFSIPVSEVMQPPVLRNSAAQSGWKDIDTSFCDTGDIDEDMPSTVDENMRASTRSNDDGEPVVEMNAAELNALQTSLIELCKDYVLMDTRGMKTTLTYREIHSGPDYELFDRKMRRRRHWLTIKHRTNDVKELLWPSAVLSAHDTAELEALQPLLSPEQMLEALVWVEAASTFAIRTRRPYDVADAQDFTPVDLHREVRVLAASLRLSANPALFFSDVHARSADEVPRRSVLLSSSALSHKDGADAGADRFITCVNLCLAHGVPVRELWAPEDDPRLASSDASGCRRMLLSVPSTVSSVQQATRIMHAIVAAVDDAAAKDACVVEDIFRFCDDCGNVTSPDLLERLSSLCSSRVFSDERAFVNVDADSLIHMVQFACVMRRANATFFTLGAASSVGLQDARATLQHFTTHLLQRARSLLYQVDGPTATVLSGDNEHIPLIELQSQAEKTDPRGLVHYNIGMRHAQGMRLSKMETHTSAKLLDLLSQLEATPVVGGALTTLSIDLVQHIAHKVANGKNRLSLDDVTRVLPHIGVLTERGQNRGASARYERLLSSCAAAIGLELQHRASPAQLTLILEGFACCGYCPSSLHAVNMAVLRLVLRDYFPLALLNRSLRALLQLVGAHAMPSDMLLRSASIVERAAGSASDDPGTVCRELLDLLRTLYYCRLPSFPSLVQCVANSPLVRAVNLGGAATDTPPSLLCAYGVVLTFAAVQADDGATDNTAHSLATRARGCLQTAWRASCPVSVDGDFELAVDSLMALAALGEEEAPCGLRGLVEEPRTDSLQWLHGLRTPSLGVSVLESLAALKLPATQVFSTYESYLRDSLASLEALSCEGAATTASSSLLSSSRSLRGADFEFLLRLLAMDTLSTEMAMRAGKLVLAEVERLSQQLDGYSVPSDRSFLLSVEATSLAKRQTAADIELSIVRGYDAIKRHRACATLLH